MTEELKQSILRDNEQLLSTVKEDGHIPILLCLGGSHAYGTNVEGSDVDVRGVYLNSKSELLGIQKDKEQYTSGVTDTTIYSLKKAAWLLKECNPAMIEMLGCREEDYIEVSPEGRMLIRNMPIFLSKKATKTFGGYAKSQLNRLVNRSGRARDLLVENEERSFEKCFLTLSDRYKGILKDPKVRNDSENVFLSFQVEDMSVSKVANLLNEFNTIDRGYRKSVRNDKAASHGKLAKHMMHLIRLYMMGIELMTYHTVHTYRVCDDHDLLMSIRNGDFLESDNLTPTKDFEDLVKEYTGKYEKACSETTLPDEPDLVAIDKLMISINERVAGKEY